MDVIKKCREYLCVDGLATGSIGGSDISSRSREASSYLDVCVCACMYVCVTYHQGQARQVPIFDVCVYTCTDVCMYVCVCLHIHRSCYICIHHTHVFCVNICIVRVYHVCVCICMRYACIKASNSHQEHPGTTSAASSEPRRGFPNLPHDASNKKSPLQFVCFLAHKK